ncbi:hypothetical protein [Azospirillum argentinense]
MIIPPGTFVNGSLDGLSYFGLGHMPIARHNFSFGEIFCSANPG